MNTLPSIISNAASEFAGLRGAASDGAVAHASNVTKSASASTWLAFVATPDDAPVDNTELVNFAASLAVQRTHAACVRAMRKAANSRVDGYVREAGERLAHALVSERR